MSSQVTQSNNAINFKHCSVIRIAKSRCKFRLIYIPNPAYKTKLQELLPKLEEILETHDECQANYAFSKGRNSALNAFQHIGYRYTISLDIQDFFDSITTRHVVETIPSDIVELCFVDGAPRQGLPTSPIVSSIAFLACDKQIKNLLERHRIQAVYTRYADDLIFSFNKKEDSGKILTLARQVLNEHGFHLNENKTRLQDSKNGRVVITGIAIDSRGLHPTRRTLKNIRAAKHQNNKSSARGLEEWAKCTLPREKSEQPKRKKIKREYLFEAKDGLRPKKLPRIVTRSSQDPLDSLSEFFGEKVDLPPLKEGYSGSPEWGGPCLPDDV